MFQEDVIDSISKIEKSIQECENLCIDKEDSILNKKMLETIKLLADVVIDELRIEYRLY